MAWITPIVNWIASNVLTPTDLNRIEGNTQYLKDNKVDKVAGKGLSTEDYTTAYKNKLEGIQAGAEVNVVTSVAGKTGDVAVSKSDVGLGSVQNYGIATHAEALVGTSDVKYMTPLRVMEAISAKTAVTGSYIGNSTDRVISFGFKPSMVIFASVNGIYVAIMYSDYDSTNIDDTSVLVFRSGYQINSIESKDAGIISSGVQLNNSTAINYNGRTYKYIAFK